jgi:FMN-dependent NADH-azoreductase
MKLLHIDSSALGAYSVSRGLTAAIVAEFRHNEPSLEVVYRDLSATHMPHWTPVADDLHPDAPIANEIMEEFLAADVIVVGAPMYNFSIPSQLKAWIDRITVVGKTFSYSEAGPKGLAGDKRVIVASSRGGAYAEQTAAAGMDFQETYLRALFGFLGVTDLRFMRAEGLAMGDEQKDAATRTAMADIGSLFRQAA